MLDAAVSDNALWIRQRHNVLAGTQGSRQPPVRFRTGPPRWPSRTALQFIEAGIAGWGIRRQTPN